MYNPRTITKLFQAKDDIFGIASDHHNIYFTTSTKHVWKVNKTNSDNTTTAIAHIKGSQFRSLVWNRDNLVYACGSSGDIIFAFESDTGKYFPVAGSGKRGYGDGRVFESSFYFPCGICVDRRKDVYVTELNHIRKIRLSLHIVQTIAGSTTGYGTGKHEDGKADKAKFNMPSGISVSEDDTIYISDQYNHCIRQIKNGIVSSIAGTPGIRGYRDGPVGEALFNCPSRIHLDIEGNYLLVGDKNHLMRKIDLKSNTVSSLKLPGIQHHIHSCMCFDSDGHIILSVGRNVYKIKNNWKWERYLWIGKLKEEANYCHLVTLPRDVIKEIAYYLYD